MLGSQFELLLYLFIYFCSKNSKLFWWDSATCGGPIVEQATHVSLSHCEHTR